MNRLRTLAVVAAVVLLLISLMGVGLVVDYPPDEQDKAVRASGVDPPDSDE